MKVGLFKTHVESIYQFLKRLAIGNNCLMHKYITYRPRDRPQKGQREAIAPTLSHWMKTVKPIWESLNLTESLTPNYLKAGREYLSI